MGDRFDLDAIFDPAGHREQIPLPAEKIDQHNTQPKVRQRDADQRHPCPGMVNQSVPFNCRINADRDGNQNRYEQAHDREFDGRRQTLENEIENRFAEFERLAEISDHGARDELPVLNRQRLVQSPFVPHARHVGRRGIIAQKEHDRITGREVHQQENQKRNAEENRYSTDKAASDHGYVRLKSTSEKFAIESR